MREVICNTSPLQYLHQLGHLHLLPALVHAVVVPQAVAEELREGRQRGHDLPDPAGLEWVSIRTPSSLPELQLVHELGQGESEVLALALEAQGSLVILDDALARTQAESLGLALTGTLGVLIDSKRKGLIPAVRPLLDRLESLHFYLARHTHAAVLELVGET